MPVFKVTFGFVSGVYGPSESYYSKTLNGNAINETIMRLITRRNAMLHTTVQWTGVRISYAPDAGKLYNDKANESDWYPPGTYEGFGGTTQLVIPGRGTYTGAEEQDQPDQSRSCMQVRVKYDDSRRTTRYVSFVPDGLIRNETLGLNFGAYVNWTIAATTYRILLASDGWSIRARNRGTGFTPVEIENWVQSDAAPGLMGFVLPSDPPSGIIAGNRVQIKNTTRRGTDGVSYNAVYKVAALNTTLQAGKTIYYLRGTEGALPESIKNTGTATKIGYLYYPIQNVLPIRGGVHKRGKPLGSPRGRRPKARSRLA